MASFKILTVFALIAGKVLFTKMDIKMFYIDISLDYNALFFHIVKWFKTNNI